MLRRHPQIFMPELKEPRFFARELHRARPAPAATPRRSTLEEYLALFARRRAGPARRRGLALLPVLAARPRRASPSVQPDARIIAILREPASFLRSLHLQLLRDHVETETRLRAGRSRSSASAARERDDPAAATGRGSVYSDHVRYVEQLRRYHEVFAPEQVLVLIYDDFRADNEATVRAGAALPRASTTTLPIEPIEANPTRARALAARWTSWSARCTSGAGPLRARAAGRASRRSHPAGCGAARLDALQRRVRLRRAAAARRAS